MKKRERILERRKLFKQELLRPLTTLIHYEIKAKTERIQNKMPKSQIEDGFLEKLTQVSENFHDFLQSHEFTHILKAAPRLQEKHMIIRAAINELRRHYQMKGELPEMFYALPHAINAMKEIIVLFYEFEKRN